MEWNYKNHYKKYDMEGIINLPNNSKLKVCDLIEEMPEFMKSADVLFIDPPCSQGNLQTFYTKADIIEKHDFAKFYKALFNRIDEINPEHLYLEIFKSNYDTFLEYCKTRYKNINIYDSFYYKNQKNKCWIFHCSNSSIKYIPEIENIDEEKVIQYICQNTNYKCIGDLCMGTGLVGKYAFLANNQFVGTELNKKRLAILLDYIHNIKHGESK